MVPVLVEIIGWSGAIALLVSYAFVSSGKLSSKSPAYQFLNLWGAAGFIVNGWYHHAYPSMALNVVWLALSMWFLLRIRATDATA